MSGNAIVDPAAEPPLKARQFLARQSPVLGDDVSLVSL